jgi:mannose-1-phosphate guanylyltransferase
MIKKCILLAAGFGTRLKPITNSTPKCLLKIHGKPLLEYWLILLHKHGITDILINTHHLSEQVVKYIKSVDMDLKITVSYEKDLLGSLGTVIHNKVYFKDEEVILVANADNLTNVNLSKFAKYHFSHDLDASIALIPSKSPSECGIVEMDDYNKIISYEEKPKNPRTNISNAGVYFFNTSIFRNLELQDDLSDIGVDLLPKLVGQSYGYLLDEFLIDIGSHSSLTKARKTIENIFEI